MSISHSLHLWVSETGTNSTLQPRQMSEHYLGFRLKGEEEQVKGFLSFFFASYGLPSQRERGLEELLFGEHGCWYANCGPSMALRQSKKRYLILVPLFGRAEKVMLTTDNIRAFVDGMSKVPRYLEFDGNRILGHRGFVDYEKLEFVDTQILSMSEVKSFFTSRILSNFHVKLPALEYVKPVESERLKVVRINY